MGGKAAQEQKATASPGGYGQSLFFLRGFQGFGSDEARDFRLQLARKRDGD
jgi:hypothetical protein